MDVVEDVRLLRLSAANLRRLGRRYPKIALQLLRNLNEFQAERLAKQTPRFVAPDDAGIAPELREALELEPHLP